MDTLEARTALEQFAQHFDYDNSYIIQLLEDSPEAFQTFAAAQAMPNFHKVLPLDAFFVAKIAVMKTEDCGPCLNLSLKMGAEQGIDRDVLKAAVKDPHLLTQGLRDIHDHTVAVIRNENDDADRMERIRNYYGIEAFAELAVVIVGCRIYPTLKRAMGMADQCELAKLDF